MDDLIFDPYAFARQHLRREGSFKLRELTRLAAESVPHTDLERSLQWSLQGGVDKEHDLPLISMQVSGQLELQCQRCLKPFLWTLDSSSTLVLARDEAHADELEEMLDDDSLDVLALEQQTPIMQLIEDEALLALPLSARHEVCPDGNPLDQLDDAKESPFAALQKLKQH
ncbi:YceD family protein [Massilia sp. W12]|uniref:YceD family protein n=1 Tax=Massilia sp. W12 TaxID=3126507 RepID=UPI0030D0376E